VNPGTALVALSFLINLMVLLAMGEIALALLTLLLLYGLLLFTGN
jgi:hypothetical protein